MNTLILFRLSFLVIKNHPGRSFLTILGIMIGISAIIVTFSVGRGAEERIKAQIMTLGENALYVIAGNVVDRGAVRPGLGSTAKLTRDDLRSIQAQVDSIKHISRGFDVLEPLTYGINSATERIFGTNSAILAIRNQEMERGAFFSNYDVNHRANVIILGNEIAKKLFKNEDPLGKTIKIKRYPFLVTGILKHISNFFGMENPNNLSYIPWTVAKKYYKKPGKAEKDVDFIAVKLGNEALKGEGLRKISRTLRQAHKIQPESESDDFMILDQQSIAKSAETASQILQLFGLLAASISLLVGGIGIMNIMLVSVQERTREIGIRLALGATRQNIQTQFLIEALSLCFIGGVLGILFGITAQQVLSSLTNLPGVLEIKPMLVSLFITMLVGVFFGYYPAYKASRLNPVEALYYH